MYRGTVEKFKEPLFFVAFDDVNKEDWEVHEVRRGVRNFEKVREEATTATTTTTTATTAKATNVEDSSSGSHSKSDEVIYDFVERLKEKEAAERINSVTASSTASKFSSYKRRQVDRNPQEPENATSSSARRVRPVRMVTPSGPVRRERPRLRTRTRRFEGGGTACRCN